MFHRSSRKLIPLALLAGVAGCQMGPAPDETELADPQIAKPKLGLFTTLPIYWGEADDITAVLDSEAGPDWVRTELEKKFEIVPLDTLEPEALEGLERVLLAQPRPLAPSENVAFDQYLANGGKAVILADPMLTRHSDFSIGDRRRPQDVVLLSPIFQRLGVELLFDEGQQAGERIVRQSGVDFPINLAGHFVSQKTGEPARWCRAIEDGLIAQCSNGEGEAYLFADAALLDWEGGEPVPQTRRTALWKLLEPLLPAASAQ